ncbi:MAG: TolC family protein [Ignavibacteriae bacterium]|nr:TolC family protein [Ignavibacteriota bacterium]NOG98705.1 TolC family protein [Ignavibacteriota bacterium]
MFLRRISLTISIIVFCSTILFGGSKKSLNELIDRAIYVSPQLKMLQAKFEAAKNKIPQNSNLPDPQLKLGLVSLPVNSFSLTQEPMTGKMISLTQGIPFPGKLGANEDVNTIDPEIILQMIMEEQNRITKEVKIAYYDYLFYTKALQFILDKKELFGSIREVVQTKYEVSKASQQNILSVDLAITNISDKIEKLKAEKEIALTKLQVYLLSSESISLNETDLTKPGDETFTYKKVESFAVDSRPLLNQIQLLKEKSKFAEEAAEYEFLPDFNLTLQYNQRDEIAASNTDLVDFFSVIVGFNLPINYGGKKSAKVEEAKSFQEYYDYQYQSALQSIQIESETLIAKLNSLREREQLIDETKMIQAGETFNAALSNYQVGEIDFINVIQAVNDLLEIETDLYRVRKNYFQEKAKLAFIAGTEF